MTPERWQQTEAMLHQALKLDHDGRTDFLRNACAGDQALLNEVESLLKAYQESGSFLESPAWEIAAKSMAQTRLSLNHVDSTQVEGEFPAIGSTVLHYHILERLGRGGMGVVYKAEDIRLGRFVALKFLSDSFVKDATALERLQSEARAASALNHPHICTIHDIAEHQGHAFIVMEFVEGQTLSAKIGGRPLELTEILGIARQIGEALEASHEKQIVHRDIKPSNVMISSHGRVKLLDFGLAFNPDSSAVGAVQSGTMVGTVQYMSPEQALAERLDHRTDLFSLGIVLYEMATGQSPFASPTAPETALKIIHAEPEAITRLNPAVPPGLERVIRRCLEKKVESRFQSARELLNSLIRTEPDTTHHRTNLPQQLTRFIGRRREVAEVQNLLKHNRLVTLSGSGGVGKTRLAFEAVAGSAGLYPDGAWLSAIVSLSNEALVPAAVASALGVREEKNRSITETLAEYLKDRRLLLVIDNCEHLIGACARLADALLRASPGLTILATSREVLGIDGEAVYRVPPLDLPELQQLDVEHVSQSEAVQLFVDRTLLANPNFAVTSQNAAALGELCIRLEGIPLAIELAASRIKVMSVEQILARLQDRFGLLTGGSRTAALRHQTLVAAIDWSYNLLTGPEQTLFRRLSIFSGGWTMEAAEAVCAGASIDRHNVHQTGVVQSLSGLVDKSLVISEAGEGQTRYRFMATLLEYARRQFLHSDEGETIARRHAEFFTQFVEDIEDKLKGSEEKTWLERLSADYDNIRAVLAWAAQRDGEIALRMAGSLQRFWAVRGYFGEAKKWLTEILDSTATIPYAGARAKALNAAGRMAWEQGEYLTAQSYCEQALALFRTTGEKLGIANALSNLGIVAQRLGDYATARSLLEEGLAICRESGDKQGIAAALNNLGVVARIRGDYELARSLHEKSLNIRRELRDKQGIAIALGNLGDVASLSGDYASARTFYEESLVIRREFGDKQGLAILVNNLGVAQQRQGDYPAARLLFEDSLKLFRELGNKQGVATMLHNLGEVAHLEGDYARARTLYEESLVRCRELGDKSGIATILHKCGETARRQGETQTAYSLYKESLVIRRELDAPSEIAESLESLAAVAMSHGLKERAVILWSCSQMLHKTASRSPSDSAEYDRLNDEARSGLGEEIFTDLWKRGQNMSLDEVFNFAFRNEVRT